jgi:hypothetical protein
LPRRKVKGSLEGAVGFVCQRDRQAGLLEDDTRRRRARERSRDPPRRLVIEAQHRDGIQRRRIELDVLEPALNEQRRGEAVSQGLGERVPLTSRAPIVFEP